MRRALALIPVVLCLISFPSIPAEDGESQRSVDPAIRVMGITILDNTEGNNDGGLHPGETASLRIWLSNLGGGLAQFVTGELEERVDHPDVELLRKSAFWPDLPGTGDGEFNLAPDFSIRIAATRPCGWIVPLRLTVRAADGFIVTRDFDLELTSGELDPEAPALGHPTIRGVASADSFGSALAAGDYNGDGIDDLVVGAPFSYGDPGNPVLFTGQVRVFFGGVFRSNSVADVQPGQRLIFGGAGEMLGTALAMGDTDGDGLDDLIVTAPDRSSNGDVFILSGSTDVTPLGLSSCCGTVRKKIQGDDAFDSFGSSLAVGDFNGDGFEDVLVGAKDGDGEFNSTIGAGEGYLILGPPPVLAGADSAAASRFWGVAGNGNVGRNSAMGDFNGDGLQDAVLGDDFSAWVIYGTPLPQTDYDLIAGQPGIDRLDIPGYVSGLATGDLNADGYDDLVLAQSSEVFVVYGDSAGLGTRAVNGHDPSISVVKGYLGAAGYSLGHVLVYGRALATGDYDGDGFDDLLLGEPRRDGPLADRGAAYLIYGGESGIPSVDLALEAYGVLRFNGSDDDNFGDSVVLGDFGGDGFSDAVIAAPHPFSPQEFGEASFFAGGARTSARWDADSYAFIDATAGVAVPLACDDCGTDISLGFDFVFDNRTYDTVTVSSNGYLTFGGDATASLGFCPGNTASPNAMIAVFWDDLNLANRGSVHTLNEGTAPNRRMTIAWVDVPLWPDEGAATFEVTLFESSNRVVMQYLDTDFGGNSPANDGQTAVAGIEGTSGAYGAQFNCRAGLLTASTSVAYRWFASPTVVYQEDFESGTGGYTGTGLWGHLTAPTCSPAAVSGSSSFYYGDTAFCYFDTGAANQGDLTSPLIPALPQDAALEFWSRRQAEDAPFDLSYVRAQGATPGYVDLTRIGSSTTEWVWADTYPLVGIDTPSGVFQKLDLSRFTAEDLTLRFSFEATDGVGNTGLGWMIDDVTIRACPLHTPMAPGGGGAAAEALATASEPTICEDRMGRVDAVGSYCTACSTGLSYQWSRGGAPISGAVDLVYDIPAGETPGSYDYTVEIGCFGQPLCDDVSEASSVAVIGRPAEVGPTLLVTPDTDPLDVRWSWIDVGDADDYVLLSDTSPVDRVVGFSLQEGVSTTGTAGIVTPRGGETRFYLVVARNGVCGEGAR